VSESENGFARSLLLLLIRALGSTLEKQPRPAARTAWQGAVWAARDTIRVLLGQLVGFMLSPRQPVRIRMFVIITLQGELKCKEILSSLLQSNAQVLLSKFSQSVPISHCCFVCRWSTGFQYF